MGLKTPLYDIHVLHGAKIVDFGGWDMPLHYGSQLEEHHAVRRDARHFRCVAHVRDRPDGCARARVPERAAGQRCRPAENSRQGTVFLHAAARRRRDRRPDRLFPVRSWFRLVVNAGTRDKDLAWMPEHAAGIRRGGARAQRSGDDRRSRSERTRRSCRALRRRIAQAALELAPFCGAAFGSWFIARTGYTGEDGFEIMLPASMPRSHGSALLSGVRAAGLGARDTLAAGSRHESLRQRHGRESSPLGVRVGMDRGIRAGDRDFIGRQALERLRGTGGCELVGLLLEERGVLRSHQKVMVAETAEAAGNARRARSGEVTSGTFSPTLNRSIALARVPETGAARVQVEIRGTWHAASIVKPPFVRQRKVLIDQSSLSGSVFPVSNIPRICDIPRATNGCDSLQGGEVEIGITDHAQGALGDLVFVEVPDTADCSRPVKPAPWWNR